MKKYTVRGLGLAESDPQWQQQLLIRLTDLIQRGTVKRLAIIGRDHSGLGIVKGLIEAGLEKHISGYYDKNLTELSALAHLPLYLSIDDGDAAVLTLPKDGYRSEIRYLTTNARKHCDILLPFTDEHCAREFDPERDGVENRKPIALFTFPCAGTNRFLPPMREIFRHFERSQGNFVQLYRFRRLLDRLLCGKTEIRQPDIDAHVVQALHSVEYYEYLNIHDPFSLGLLEGFPDIQAVALIRDPRDTVVSYYHRLYGTRSAELDGFFLGELCDKQKEERLLQIIEGGTLLRTSNYFLVWPSIAEMTANFLAATRLPHVKAVRFEELRAAPQQIFRSLIDWLDLERELLAEPISAAQLDHAIFLGSFESQTGGARREGDEHNAIHMNKSVQTSCRKGVAGDWKNHFTPRVKDRVKELAGEGLVALGYEQDLNW